MAVLIALEHDIDRRSVILRPPPKTPSAADGIRGRRLGVVACVWRPASRLQPGRARMGLEDDREAEHRPGREGSPRRRRPGLDGRGERRRPAHRTRGRSSACPTACPPLVPARPTLAARAHPCGRGAWASSQSARPCWRASSSSVSVRRWHRTCVDPRGRSRRRSRSRLWPWAFGGASARRSDLRRRPAGYACVARRSSPVSAAVASPPGPSGR